MLHAHFTALCYRRVVIGDGIFTLRRSGLVLTRSFLLREYWMVFDLSLAPVTLTLTR